MKWSESESAAKLYIHYFNELIRAGKIVIASEKADSLAHILRGVLKGFAVRNHAPYSALSSNVIVKVGHNQITLVNKKQMPAIDPISDREFRVLAPCSYEEVLSAIGSMKDDKIDRAAFLQVDDLNETNRQILERLCRELNYTLSLTEKTVVIIK